MSQSGPYVAVRCDCSSCTSLTAAASCHVAAFRNITTIINVTENLKTNLRQCRFSKIFIDKTYDNLND